MAKKKVSHAQRDNPSQKQEEPVKSRQETPHSAMDSVKIESLKSLNQILVKEAVERRQQVDSLLHSKGSLELELDRSKSERDSLKSELALLVERVAVMEIEREMVAVFVAVQVAVEGEGFDREFKGLEMEMQGWKGENQKKEREIEILNAALSKAEGALDDEREVWRRVRLEMDDIQDNLNRQIKENEGLRVNLIELDGKMKGVKREIDALRTANDALGREKKDMEMMILLLLEEKDSSERSLMESNKLIEKMEEEINGILREKEGIQKEKNDEIVKRQELENVVSQLNEVIANLKQEAAKLQRVVEELEQKCVGRDEKLKERGREIDRLVEEAKISEKGIQALVDEKSGIEKDLFDAKMQLTKQKIIIANLDNENIAVLEAKNRVDGQVGELQNHVDELNATISGLEESNRADVEKIRRLESEVRDCMSKLEEVSVEKDEVGRFLMEEKQIAWRLKEKIQELEKKIEESLKASAEVKEELESRCEMQRKEIASLQEMVTKARDECDTTKTKVLKMLKGTSDFCSKDEQGENVVVDGEELKLHSMEMETIKDAFKSKAAKMEDMERKLERLQSCVVDAEKWKSFWAMLASVTTVLAAISLAYVARGH